MGTVYITHINAAGLTLKATIERLADGYFREDDTETFVSAPAFSDKDITLTEGSSENAGTYTNSVTATTWNDGLYRIRIHDTSVSNRTISTSVFAVKGGYEVAIGEESSVFDLYTADIQLIVDAGNATPVDEYIVIWSKNGVPLTTEVTASTIQVVKRTDGTNLIASTAMTEVVSGTWKYDSTSARQTAGETYKVICVGTISGSTITRAKGFGRDSAA